MGTAVRLMLSVALACCGQAALGAEVAAPSPLPDAAAAGAALYAERCAGCHDSGQGRVSARAVIASRSPDSLVTALTTGVMKEQAAGLTGGQIRSIAVFLTGKEPGSGGEPDPDANLCTRPAGPLRLEGSQWNGWGRDLENSRYQPQPGFKAADVPRLRVKWAFAYPGEAYGEPVIAGNRLYLTSKTGVVFSLDAATGCTHWTFRAAAGVKTAVSVGVLPPRTPARFAAYFGDEQAAVYAVDAESGRLLWKTKVEDHPVARITGAPILYGNRLYVPVSSLEELAAGRNPAYPCCTFRGSIVALDAATGTVLWKTYTVAETPTPFRKTSAGTELFGPAGAAIWSCPTIDVKRNRIYAGTGNSYTDVETDAADAILALDLKTGTRAWSRQVARHDNFIVGCRNSPSESCPQPVGPDFDFGSPPILRTLSSRKQLLLAGSKSGIVYALDPEERGNIIWQVKVAEGSAMGGVLYGPAADADNIYIAISDVFAKPGHVPGGLVALKIASGEQLWRTPAPAPVCSWGPQGCSQAQQAAVTVIPGVVFSGSLDGHIRAYSTRDGTIIWDYDTARSFDAVNGTAATGGSVNGAAQIVANGTLYVNSGYSWGTHAGNVLLAFTIDGR